MPFSHVLRNKNNNDATPFLDIYMIMATEAQVSISQLFCLQLFRLSLAANIATKQ